MPTSNSIRHRHMHDWSTPLFVIAFLVMCLCETFIVRGLWFRVLPGAHRRGSDLAFLIWIPYFVGLILRTAIAKRVKKDDISAAVAAQINSGLGGVLLVAYLLMTRLAQFAFR